MAAQWYSEMMPYEKCIYLNNRGNSYYFRKDYPHALEMFRKELAFARSYPDMAFEVHLSEMNLGETFLLMNQTDSAAGKNSFVHTLQFSGTQILCSVGRDRISNA